MFNDQQRKTLWRTLRDAINGLIPQVIIAVMAAAGFAGSIS